MPSDVKLHPPSPPARPPDLNGTRARRTLAASEAARNGIATMVDALRVSKPPRAPSTPSAQATRSRRHSLIPLAEGRNQLESRIRALEDAISRRDTDALMLKKQLGRALVKRRYLERERDVFTARISSLLIVAREAHARARSARADTVSLLDDLASPLNVLSTITDHPALEDITSAIDIARGKLSVPLPHLSTDDQNSTNIPTNFPVQGLDDDGRSCTSFPSSTAVGDDRDAQLDTLVELVAILEAKLSLGAPHAPASAAVSRAKRTISAAKEETNTLVAERDRLKEQLDAVMKEKEAVGGEEAALALHAKAEAELCDARRQLQDMRHRLACVEKVADRAVRQEDVLSRNTALEHELRSAKKTVGRLVQERNSLRKFTPVCSISSPASAAKVQVAPDSDAIKKVLDWRQRVSGENNDLQQPVFDDDQPNVSLNKTEESNARKEMLPNRPPVDMSRSPIKKRRVTPVSLDVLHVNETPSLGESADRVPNDSASAQSLPVQGFLLRHDSFLSAGSVSASGDAITISNSRNIFSAGAPRVDGLRGLLGGL